MSAKSNRSAESLDKQLNELIKEEDSQDDLYESNDASTPRDRSENVLVMVRCRPMLGQSERASQTAQSSGSSSRRSSSAASIQVDEANKCIQLDSERQFYYDQVFGPESDNERVYMRSARKLVEWAFAGFNCTIFLYGQTGTGKTFTHSSLTSSSFAHLFTLIGDSNQEASFLIRASYYELYNENIRDLLSNSSAPLELRESKSRGVYVKDLSCFLVNNLKELEKLKHLGDKRRTVGATKMNEHSSRSHSIFSITIETISAKTKEDKTRANSKNSPDIIRMGRLNLIDLAGSERQAKSGSSGLRLKEASRINLSLTCLSLVIRALTDSNSTHVPYRSSKLTRLLSSSLGGNSKTLLIACISPAPLHLDETLNTLRFASRTKRIKNKARINEDPKDALLRNYKRQVDELRRKLSEQQQASVVSDVTTLTTEDDNDNNRQLLAQLQLLKAKIMVGGENLLEKVEMHDRLLEASKVELEERRKEELELKAKLEKKRELIRRMNQSKESLEDQKVNLDEKLRKVLLLYKRSKEELADLGGEHEELKSSLLQTIKATSKEIKYADCIIEDFIPRNHLDLINSYAQYDDDSDEWQIKLIAMSGNNMAQTRRLIESSQGSSQDVTTNHSATIDANIHREGAKKDAIIRVPTKHRPNPYVRLIN